MKEKYCQSCGMPMGDDDRYYGTNEDRSKNEDYCKYCFIRGRFTSDCTMDEMINICIPHMVEAHPEMKEEEAREMMKNFFPHLKRWKEN